MPLTHEAHCKVCGTGPLRFPESIDAGVCYNCRMRDEGVVRDWVNELDFDVELTDAMLLDYPHVEYGTLRDSGPWLNMEPEGEPLVIYESGIVIEALLDYIDPCDPDSVYEVERGLFRATFVGGRGLPDIEILRLTPGVVLVGRAYQWSGRSIIAQNFRVESGEWRAWKERGRKHV